MAFRPTKGAWAEYNCIAWALRYRGQVIWPDDDEQLGWPPDLPRNELLDTFKRFFEMAGFAECADGALEVGFEKIAIYTTNGLVSHAARQLPTGLWTSKMGVAGAEGVHDTVDEICGPGQMVALYMRRQDTGRPPRRPNLFPAPPRLINPIGGPLIR